MSNINNVTQNNVVRYGDGPYVVSVSNTQQASLRRRAQGNGTTQ